MTAASDREEGQRRRADARQQRRDTADPQHSKPEHAAAGGDAEKGRDSEAPESHDTLKQAAKIALAGAAVGAAAGAAHALASRDGHDSDSDEHDDAADAEPDERSHEARARDAQAAPEHEEAEAPADEDDERAEEDDADAETRAAVEEAGPEPTSSQDPSDGQGATGSGGREREEQVEGGTLEETTDVVRRAREQLEALQGREPESVSSLERTHDGWIATFEVVELSRVPDSTDVMASYEVVLDEQKNVRRYARIRRYYRSQADRETG